MKAVKKIQGITLISLVITIIVLTILTSVSVSVIIGNNGLIEESVKARESLKIKEIKEKIGLELIKSKYINKDGKKGLDIDKAREMINEKYGTLEDDNDTITLDKEKSGVAGTLSLEDVYEGSFSDVNNTPLTGTLNKIDLTKENSNNYITWASDKKSLKLNDGNVYAGTIDSSAAYEAGSNSMPHRTGENYTYDGKVDNQYYHIHFPTGWYNTWDGASWAPEVRIPISQAPNTQIWKDAYNAGKGSIQTALFGGTTQTVSINCSTSTNASVYVHSGKDPLWTEYNANYSGKSDNIYLLKDPSGNSAIANTITISYNCGGNEAYGQEYRYSQKIYLKDATGKVIDSISNGNGSRTWNLFTYSIGGDYVYLEYQLTAYVRYTKSNPDGQARAYSSMTTPSVIYLYGK